MKQHKIRDLNWPYSGKFCFMKTRKNVFLLRILPNKYNAKYLLKHGKNSKLMIRRIDLNITDIL